MLQLSKFIELQRARLVLQKRLHSIILKHSSHYLIGGKFRHAHFYIVPFIRNHVVKFSISLLSLSMADTNDEVREVHSPSTVYELPNSLIDVCLIYGIDEKTSGSLRLLESAGEVDTVDVHVCLACIIRLVMNFQLQ